MTVISNALSSTNVYIVHFSEESSITRTWESVSDAGPALASMFSILKIIILHIHKPHACMNGCKDAVSFFFLSFNSLVLSWYSKKASQL